MGERVRLRAVLLGLVLGVGLCAAAPLVRAYHHGAPLAGGHFPMAPFFIVSWLFVFSAILGRIRKGLQPFTGLELLVAWALMTIVSGLGWAGLTETLFINITAPNHFSKDAFQWTESLRPLLPESWYPSFDDSGQAAVSLLYNGLEGGRDMGWFQVLGQIPWAAWAGPILTWCLFILLCYFVMVCLAVLFGRQWVTNERVNFPLLSAPLAMGEALDEKQGKGLFGLLSNRFLLLGLLLTMFMHGLNGLHFYHPTTPHIPVEILAGSYFPKYGVFSGFRKLSIHLYPAFIGFAFLTTRHISFSFWFFYVVCMLLYGLLYIFGMQYPEAALGTTFGPTFARPEEAQTIGAYLVFFLFLIWLARSHLGAGLKRAIGRGVKNPDNPGPPGWAVWGAAAGLGALMAWCFRFGLSPVSAVLLPLGLFLVLVVASRIVCQGGLPYFTLNAAPTDGFLGFFGSGFFGRAGLLAAAVMQKVLFVDLRETLLPSLIHGEKIRSRTRNRALVLIFIGLAIVLALAASILAMLALCHKYGLRELDMEWAATSTLYLYENVQKLLDAPSGPNTWVIVFATAGALVMAGLCLMYYRFSWWPIHPIGYLAAYSAGMRILWFSFFLGWLMNHLCLRYGGNPLFRKLRYLFIGLIIGDFLMAGLWALIGLFAGGTYQVFPL